MYTYRVVGKNSIAVRKYPTPDSGIVNIIPPNGIIYALGVENGWIKTHAGFYVFKTDDIKIDQGENTPPGLFMEHTTPKKGLNMKFNLMTFAASSAAANTGNPSVNDGGNGTSNPANSEVSATKDDLTPKQTEEQRIESINEKYSGKGWTAATSARGYQTDGNGNISYDSYGNPIMVQLPQDFFDKPPKCTIQSIDSKGVMRVADTTGAIWYVNASEGQAYLGTENDSAKYETVDVTQEMAEQSAVEKLLVAIESAKSRVGEILNKTFSYFNKLEQITVDNARSVYGFPYQFLPTADNRPYQRGQFPLIKFGRKFMEKIVLNSPILTMQAGIPEFLPDTSLSLKNLSIDSILGAAASTFSSDIERMINQPGQYYTFKPTPEDYYDCVNGALRAMAQLLGIGGVSIPTSTGGTVTGADRTLGGIKWQDMAQHPYAGHYAGAVSFYINSEAQVQESFSNATRQSELAGKVNQLSDQAMEIQFLMGGLEAAGNWGKDSMTQKLASKLPGLDAFLGGQEGLKEGNYRNGTGMINSLVKNISTMLAGGKMIFPEIWSDSSFARAYNITIKLDSPDCDEFSVYMNILVPLIHILAFVLPRSAGDNSYISPFLVRAFYKSMFHVDMGIITNCEVTRGATGMWNKNGLPTEVTVTFTLKDMYTHMSQALNTNDNNVITNPAQLDYIANLCGINVAPTNFMRSLDLWLVMNGVSRFQDIVEGSFAHATQQFFRIFFK